MVFILMEIKGYQLVGGEREFGSVIRIGEEKFSFVQGDEWVSDRGWGCDDLDLAEKIENVFKSFPGDQGVGWSVFEVLGWFRDRGIIPLAVSSVGGVLTISNGDGRFHREYRKKDLRALWEEDARAVLNEVEDVMKACCEWFEKHGALDEVRINLLGGILRVLWSDGKVSVTKLRRIFYVV